MTSTPWRSSAVNGSPQNCGKSMWTGARPPPQLPANWSYKLLEVEGDKESRKPKCGESLKNRTKMWLSSTNFYFLSNIWRNVFANPKNPTSGKKKASYNQSSRPRFFSYASLPARDALRGNRKEHQHIASKVQARVTKHLCNKLYTNFLSRDGLQMWSKDGNRAQHVHYALCKCFYLGISCTMYDREALEIDAVRTAGDEKKPSSARLAVTELIEVHECSTYPPSQIT